MKKTICLFASAALLASCGGASSSGISSASSINSESSILVSSETKETSNTITIESASSEEGANTSIESEETSDTRDTIPEEISDTSFDQESAAVSFEDSLPESSEDDYPPAPEGYNIPSLLEDYLLVGGESVNLPSTQSDVSIEIDSSTGRLFFVDKFGDTLLKEGNEAEGAGYLPLECEYVVSIDGGRFALTKGVLEIEEAGELTFVTYTCNASSSLHDIYVFGNDAISVIHRSTGMMMGTVTPLQQYLLQLKDYGFIYATNSELYYGLIATLDGSEENVNSLVPNNIYELSNADVSLAISYYEEGSFVRAGLERGIYFCEGQPSLELNGFGDYTLGEVSGSYVYQNDGTSVYLISPDGDNRELYFIDMENLTYSKHEETPAVDFPLPLGTYVEGYNSYATSTGVTRIFQFSMSFSSFTEGRVAEFIYADMLPSDIYSAKKVNTGAWNFTYDGESFTMTHSINNLTWSWSVSPDNTSITLLDSPLGIEDIPNTVITGNVIASDND